MGKLNKDYLESLSYMHDEKARRFIKDANLRVVGADLCVYDPWNELKITEAIAIPSWKVLYPDWTTEK